MPSQTSKPTYHIPVLAEESVASLAIKSTDVVMDLTCGGGGHSSLFINKLGSGGHLIMVDRDAFALEETYGRFLDMSDHCELAVEDFGTTKIGQTVARGVMANGATWQMIKSPFSALRSITEQLSIKPNCIFADLGVSSAQLDEAERGFSYRFSGPLDMRMDAKSGLSARELLQTCTETELTNWLREYGEERYAKRIAHAICRERQSVSLKTTMQLADIVINAMPAASRREAKHPAKRTFQALRIVVNNELGELKSLLETAPQVIASEGRLGILTFHSLEDRLVKDAYRYWEKDCICPPSVIYCQCGKLSLGKSLPRRGIEASAKEQAINRRSHSARLRNFVFAEVKHG